MNLLEYLKIEVVKQTPDEVQLKMPIEAIHLQPFGYLHGGINGVLIETACSIGANQQLDDINKFAVGINLEVQHLTAVSNGTLLVTATPVNIAKHIQVWKATIINEQHVLVSSGNCTMYVK